MSKMFDYISGKAEGREAELEATLEHVMAHCVPEPEYDRLKDALIQIRAVCEDNPNMATNFIDEIARIALNPNRK